VSSTGNRSHVPDQSHFRKLELQSKSTCVRASALIRCAIITSRNCCDLTRLRQLFRLSATVAKLRLRDGYWRQRRRDDARLTERGNARSVSYYRIANQQRKALEWIRMSTTRLVFGYVIPDLFLFSEACAHAIGLHAKQSPQTNTPPDLVCYWILKKKKKEKANGCDGKRK